MNYKGKEMTNSNTIFRIHDKTSGCENLYVLRETRCETQTVYNLVNLHTGNMYTNYVFTDKDELLGYIRAHRNILSVDIVKCTCGNPSMGFGCTCEWSKKNPGLIVFYCEFCGIYEASKPKCNKCEVEE